MAYQDLHSAVITILSAVITGGFVLIFVEIGNRKNRENDRYRQLMTPFFQKLSAYFRYINWVSTSVCNPKPDTDEEKEFKNFLHRNVGKYGSNLITSGGDYTISSFTAKELQQIGYDINHVWFMYDRWDLRRLRLDNNDVHKRKYIDKELSKLNRYYLSMEDNVSKIAKVSGEFYTDFYQPVQDEPFFHDMMIKLYHRQSVIVGFSLFLVLLTLCALVCFTFPTWLLKFSMIFITSLLGLCLLLLFIDENRQLQIQQQLKECKKKLLEICQNQEVSTIYYHKMYL